MAKSKKKIPTNPPQAATEDKSGVTISGMVANCKTGSKDPKPTYTMHANDHDKLKKRLKEANDIIIDQRNEERFNKNQAEDELSRQILKVDGIDEDKIYTKDEILAEVDQHTKFSAEVFAPGEGIYTSACEHFLDMEIYKKTQKRIKPYDRKMLKRIFNHERGNRGLKVPSITTNTKKG